MEPHVISTKVPVDSPIGEEMVIFRTSRGAKKPDGLQTGDAIILRGPSQDVLGRVLLAPPPIPFREVSDVDIRCSYFAGTRERRLLLDCLREMYAETGFDEHTLTTVIRCRRLS